VPSKPAPKAATPEPPARKPPPPKPPVVAAAAPPARDEAKPSPAAAPVRAFAELPEDLKRQVPAMTIGGSVHSPQPASRMLIVNGQVMREGATLAPGLQLESIGRQSAIFSIRGQRFEMKL
jgi:general secretion pathway protein B